MKSLTRTIIMLVVFNLAMGNLALAQAEGQAKPTARRRAPAPTPPEPTSVVPMPEAPVPPEPPVPAFTISGRTGLSGVVMQGLPGNPVTDERGYYTVTVPYSWSGRVIPVKEGYTFEPASMIYRKITNNRNDQNYVAELITYTISEVIFVGGIPIQGVRVSANNGGGSDVTDAQGRFSVKVPYNWSGEITLEKEGFRLPSKSYTNVTKNIKVGGLEPPRRPSSRGRITTTAQPYEPAVGRISSRKVLVIPDSDLKPEELDAITQDLLVMSHILDEKFKGSRTIKGVFTDFGDFFGRDNRSTEAIYMQGYGVVFLMEVNFAFSPPLKPEEQKDEEPAEQIDPTWQRARQQIFAPKTPMPGFSEQGPGLVKFDQLKKELIETLKHAANIRNITPDEWIIVTVIGQGRQSGEFYEDYYRNATPRSRTSRDRRSSRGEAEVGAYGGGMVGGMSMGMGGYGGYGGGMMGGYGGGMGGFGGGMMGGMGVYEEMGPPSATVMTIRAKKSDVSYFATGEQPFDQFQETVEIFTY